MEMVRVYNYHTGEILEKPLPIPWTRTTSSSFWTFWEPAMSGFITAKSSIKSFLTGQKI